MIFLKKHTCNTIGIVVDVSWAFFVFDVLVGVGIYTLRFYEYIELWLDG